MMIIMSDIPEIIQNMTGKHIKQTLQRLEDLGILNQNIRKVILDEMNDFNRDLLKELGYEESK